MLVAFNHNMWRGSGGFQHLFKGVFIMETDDLSVEYYEKSALKALMEHTKVEGITDDGNWLSIQMLDSLLKGRLRIKDNSVFFDDELVFETVTRLAGEDCVILRKGANMLLDFNISKEYFFNSMFFQYGQTYGDIYRVCLNIVLNTGHASGPYATIWVFLIFNDKGFLGVEGIIAQTKAAINGKAVINCRVNNSLRARLALIRKSVT